MRFQTVINHSLFILLYILIILPIQAKNTKIQETTTIEFAAFSLEIDGNEGILKWEVSNPSDAYHFEVWRSVDDFSYERTVESIKMTASANAYSFSDHNLGSFDPLTVSYRIRIVGDDGFFLYSDVIRVVPKKGGYPIYSVVGQNPTSETLILNCKMSDLNSATLNIYNASGEQVYRDENVKGQGNVKVELDVRNWAKGFYYIYLRKDNYTVTHKVAVF